METRYRYDLITFHICEIIIEKLFDLLTFVVKDIPLSKDRYWVQYNTLILEVLGRE